jgi:signal transduction histidine kinase
MGTAILKVQHREARSDSSRSLLAAALDASPDPIAIVENGSVVYSNRSFADSEDSFLSRNGKNRQTPWQQTPFSANGRAFTLHTRQRNPSESQHLMLVGRLVSGVAHDFNNLLTGILLYCDLLGAKLTADEPMGRKIEEIRVAAEHGATLIRQLMCVGREAKGEPRYVSFSHAIEDVLPLLKHMVGENIHVSLKLKDNGATVAVSQAQAQQIILNLVLNARDAMPDGGLVRLETRARPFEGTGPGNRMFELVVTDTGPGMDAPTAARIFEPFFTTKERGTGMGLATVRHIVEDAGGLVCVDTSPGDGTRMTVRLPEVNINHATSCPDVLDAPALSTQR